MKEVTIQENDAGQRLDRFLTKSFPNLSKSLMYKAIRNKKIKVNRKRAEIGQKLEAGDVVLLFLPEDVLMQKERKITGKPILDVVYEDDDLLVVNKPYGLLCQKDSDQDQDTLNDRVIAWLYANGKYDPKSENSFVPAICHRLDRNTTGLVIAAKNAKALRDVNEAIKGHDIKKYYKARVLGIPKEGYIKVCLKKDGTKALISQAPKEGYVPAEMIVKVLKPGKTSEVEIELLTGRFHQIRATMAALGNPLIGDVKYGYAGPEKKYDLKAYKLDLSCLYPEGKIIELKS